MFKTIKKIGTAIVATVASVSGSAHAALDPAIQTAVTAGQTDGISLVTMGIVAVIGVIAVVMGFYLFKSVLKSG